jgi:hypothetical protein
MPNGKIGDHPYTDIVIHGRRVYSEKADALILEISRLADDSMRRQLQDQLMRDFNEYYNPDIEKLEQVLVELRDRLVSEARDRGFEV